jgi:hypothetical protein
MFMCCILRGPGRHTSYDREKWQEAIYLEVRCLCWKFEAHSRTHQPKSSESRLLEVSKFQLQAVVSWGSGCRAGTTEGSRWEKGGKKAGFWGRLAGSGGWENRLLSFLRLLWCMASVGKTITAVTITITTVRAANTCRAFVSVTLHPNSSLA